MEGLGKWVEELITDTTCNGLNAQLVHTKMKTNLDWFCLRLSATHAQMQTRSDAIASVSPSLPPWFP